MEKYLIAHTRHGLANRLKCLLSAMRLAEKTSRQLLLFWPVDERLDCKFTDLFENEIPEIEEEEFLSLSLRSGKDDTYQILNTWRLETFEEDPLPRPFPQSFPSKTKMNIDFEYQRIPAEVRDIFLGYTSRLRPRENIVEAAESASQMFRNNTTSFSIRSWDNSPRRVGLFSLQKVYEVMDKIQDGNFFVSCDSKAILEKIIAKYGSRILFYPRNKPYKNGKIFKEAQAALVDLYLLGKNRGLKASYLSTFSEMAWWFGGCQADVEIISPQTHFCHMIRIGKRVFGFSLLWNQWVLLGF